MTTPTPTARWTQNPDGSWSPERTPASSSGGGVGPAGPTGPSGAAPLTTKGDLLGFDTVANRVPIGADGQVLTADSAQSLGLKWASAAAARAPIDQVTLHATYGDDFAAGSLDAKWTRRTITSGAETWDTTDYGWLRADMSGAPGLQYHQACPAGDFSVVTSWVYFCSEPGSLGSSNDEMCGPMIIDSSGAGVAACHYGANQTALSTFLLAAYAYNNYGGSFYTGIPGSGNGLRLWTKLTKAGTTYTACYSRDGKIWSPPTPNYTWAGTPNRIGFGTIYGTRTTRSLNIDRFNVI